MCSNCLARSIPESWLPGSLAPSLPGSLVFCFLRLRQVTDKVCCFNFGFQRYACTATLFHLAPWLPGSLIPLAPWFPCTLAPWLPGSLAPGSLAPQLPSPLALLVVNNICIYICSHFDSSSNSSRYYNVQYHLLCIPEVPDGNGSSSHAGELVCFEEVLRNDEGAATKERSVCCSRADNNYNLRGQMHLDGVK